MKSPTESIDDFLQDQIAGAERVVRQNQYILDTERGRAFPSADLGDVTRCKEFARQSLALLRATLLDRTLRQEKERGEERARVDRELLDIREGRTL